MIDQVLGWGGVIVLLGLTLWVWFSAPEQEDETLFGEGQEDKTRRS